MSNHAHSSRASDHAHALFSRVNEAPDSPTDEWPGGYLIRHPDNTFGRPWNGVAYRTRQEAASRARPHDQVIWVSSGSSWGGMPIPLDAAYWAAR